MTDREVWVRFAMAALNDQLRRFGGGTAPQRAARVADKMLKEYHERFPQEGPYR